MTFVSLILPFASQITAALDAIDTTDTAADVYGFGFDLIDGLGVLDDLGNDQDGVIFRAVPVTVTDSVDLAPSTAVVVGITGDILSGDAPIEEAALQINDSVAFSGGVNALIALFEATVDTDGTGSSGIAGMTLEVDVLLGASQIAQPDLVVATAQVTGTGDGTLSATGLGITGAPLATGGGDDVVLASASTTHDRNATAVGMDVSTSVGSGLALTTGSGADRIVLAAQATSLNDPDTGVGDAISQGLILTNMRVETGDGADEMLVTATTAATDFGSATGIRINQSQAELSLGDGADVLDVLATSVSENTAFATAISMTSDALITTGAGADTLALLADATAAQGGAIATGVTAFMVAEVGLDLGDGDDLLDIEANAVGPDNAEALGLSNVIVDTGAGGDTVLLTAFAAGGPGSRAAGAAGSEIILGEAGENDADVLNALATIDPFSDGTAVGFDSVTLSAGGGPDVITATGSGGTQSFGMRDSTIVLGAGDDVLTTRGDTAGVSGISVLGGAGSDTFDLHSGVAQIDGGAGTDTLVLAAASSGFLWNGTLLVDDNGTAITMTDVEFVTFADGTFAVDDLL